MPRARRWPPCASTTPAVVTVVNDAGNARPHPPEGAGQGLIGMRQRAELYGGSLRTGPAPGGGFAVTATFPLDDVGVPRREGTSA